MVNCRKDRQIRTHTFDHPPPSVRVWVRGVFRLADGREITRTVRWDGDLDPTDEERKAVLLYELIAELEHAGRDFPEGRGVMVQVLGVATG